MTVVPKPALSVLLVTYNHARFVAEALNSILMQQTDFDFEIVAVDDCSTDGTLSALAEYESREARLRVLPAETNLGISRNFQRGFAACRGEYIAVIEGDDFWISPKKLQVMQAFLERHPECSFGFHRVIKYAEHPESAAVYPKHWTVDQTLTVNELIAGNFATGLSACVYRRQAIESLKPELWDLDIREWFFNIVVAQSGTIAYVAQILSVYRTHAGGIWSLRPQSETIPELVRLIKEYDEFLDFRFTEEFEAYRQTLPSGSPAKRVARRRLAEARLKLWVGYWQMRSAVSPRLPVRVKRVLKRLIQ